MQLSEAQPRLPPLQGLKFLLVSADSVISSRIQNQLPKPHYQISTTPSCFTALRLLECENFDLVLSDCSWTDMNVYEFIFEVQLLRKNIPLVVIFEAERSDDEIIRAIAWGACYNLRKPLSEPSDEIRNLWQHVFRTRAQNQASSSLVSSQQEGQERGNEFMNHGEEPSKKPWFHWTAERHAVFVEVVKQLGKDATPKKIFEKMNENEPDLTREIVASHLQKYRESKKKRGRDERQLPEQHIDNRIFVPPVVSSAYHLEASTTHSLPPPLPQMQSHHYNDQQLARQRQIQLKHRHHYFGVTPLMGNGVNDLTSSIQRPSLSSCGRRMHQPVRISNDGKQALGTSFKSTNPQISQNPSSGSGITYKNQAPLLQNPGLGSSPLGTTIRGANQSQSNQNQASSFSSHGSSNMLPHQLDQNSCLDSSHHGTAIGGASQSQSNQNQVSYFSSHGATIRGANQSQSNQNQGVGIGMQQLDQNPSPGSGIVMQHQPIAAHQFDQEDSLDKLLQNCDQPFKDCFSDIGLQYWAGIGMQQLDQNPSPGSGIVMQHQPIAAHQFDQEDSLDKLLQNCDQPFKDCFSDIGLQYWAGIGMQQLDQNPSPGSGIVMQHQPIAAHQFDQEHSLDVDSIDLDGLFQNCDQLFEDCFGNMGSQY